MNTAVMELECNKITKRVLPAIRASVAERMKEKYGCSQQQIGKALGIAQVAVSKYLNGQYSEDVAKIKRRIMSEELDVDAVRLALDGDPEKVGTEIDRLCARIVAEKLVNR